MAEEKRVLLTFSTLLKPTDFISIDEVDYPFLGPGNFGPEVNALNRNRHRLNQQLYENPTPENLETAIKGRDELVFKFVPGLKDNPVYEKLDEAFKDSIVEIFFERAAALDYRPKPKEPEANKPK